ncbi:pentapeptide repeat-containing protein [Streptomyces goshikiensis]|uniref:pentapeptide repeat-containing protein n=1 Tax=Streptomyces goshikiensis TaxID=1942 RepID=UPI00380A9C27
MPDTTALELLRHLAAADEELRPALLKHVSEVTQGLIDTTGRGMDLTEADLSNLDLRRVDLRRATLNRALLHGTRLQEADLSEVSMVCPGMERTNLTGASLRSAYVHALAAQTCVFDGADLTGLRDATGTLFHGCSMRGTHLDDGHLSGSSFYQCDLSDASMRNMNLQGALISECLLDSAALDGSCVDQLSVTKSSLRDTSLRSAAGHGLVLQRLTAADGLVLADAGLPQLRLTGVQAHDWRAAGLKAPDADFTDLTVTAADFSGAQLTGARWTRCTLPEVRLGGASLSNGSIVESCLRGAVLTAARGENLHIVESDLSDAEMSTFLGRCLTVRDSSLARANLRHANLYRAMITGDPPRGMSLRRAVLDGATLVQAYIAADLREAGLVGANCAYSRFSQSDLSGARLDGAGMYQSTWVKTVVTGASLTGVKAPVFTDRCPGLAEALERDGGPAATEFAAFVENLGAALAKGRKGST